MDPNPGTPPHADPGQPRAGIMCADDNEIMAEALSRYFRSIPDLLWLGCITDPDRITAEVVERRPAVLLLDIDIPGADSFDILRELNEAAPSVRVVMFSGHVRKDYIDRALTAGAWGYISKNDRPAEIVRLVNEVARGSFALSREVETEMGRA